MRITTALAALALTLVALPARASPVFPGEVRTHLALPGTPLCTLCHQSLAGGFGTATKPFGVAVRNHGATATNTASLDTALDAMAKAATDQDQDCVADIEELKNEKDPDDPTDHPGACGDGGPSGGSSGAGTPLQPQYGCAAAPERSGSETPVLVGVGAALGAYVMLRRRRPRRRNDS